MKKKLTEILVMVCLLFTSVVNVSLAYAITSDEKDAVDTTTAPEGYKTEISKESLNSNLYGREKKARKESSKKVLLVEDTLPWSTETNTVVLNLIGAEYDKVSTANFLKVNLSEYGVIIISNDQTFSAYENYVNFKEYIEKFTSIGGVVIFGACDGGWAGGNLIENLPGDVKKSRDMAYRNYVSDASHSIINGKLTDGQVLENDELYEYYTSHIYFDEGTLPAGSDIIIRSSNNNAPTLVEYPLGKGRVIASGLTWEFNYVHGGKLHPRGGNRGNYAKIAMEDMFRYAIRVSKIDVKDLKILEDYYANKNAHHIVVASRSTKEPIKDARVIINNKEYTTDDNGMIDYNGKYGVFQIKAKATNYRINSIKKNVQARDVTYIFLDEDDKDGLPYVTLACEVSDYKDVRSQTVHFQEGSDTFLNLQVDGEWGSHGSGKYMLYQNGVKGGANGKFITRDNGNFFFKIGNEFNPEQPVYLKMIARDGRESKPIKLNIYIDEKIVDTDYVSNGMSDLENIDSFTIADPQSGSVSDSDVAAVFPGDYDLKISSLPITVNKSVNQKDGSYTYKIAIGIGQANWLDNSSKWETFKYDFGVASKNADNTDRLAGLIQAYNGKAISGGFTVTNKWKNKLSSVGYYECKYDKSGKMINQSGGIIIDVNGNYSLSKQFLLGPVPVYFDLTGGVSLKYKGGVNHNNDVFTFTSNLSITPSMAIGGGIGVKGVATVGVEGGAKLSIDIAPNTKGVLTPEAYIKMYLLFIFDYKFKIASKDFVLWDQKEKYALNGQKDINIGDIKVASNDYAKKTTIWNGQCSNNIMKSNIKKIIDNDAANIQTLQKWVRPNTIPQVEKVGDSLVMVFQATDSLREAVNGSKLMYTVYDGKYWSDPIAVWDNGTNDMYTKMISVNNELYLLWQKNKDAIKSGDIETMLKEAAGSSEIAIAKFDKYKKEFIDESFITDNDVIDMCPSLAYTNNKLTAVWVSSDNNDILSNTGKYKVKCSTLENDKWTESVDLFETEEHISEISTSYINDKLCVVLESDNNGTKNIKVIYDNKDSIIDTGNEQLCAVKTNGNSVYWYRNGSIYGYDVITGAKTEVLKSDNYAVTSSYEFVEGSNKSAIVWILPGEDTYKVQASMKNGESYCSPITLLEVENKSIMFMDSIIDDDGYWNIVMNTQEDDNDDKMNSLVYAKVSCKNDSELVYANALDSERVNNIQPFYYNVSNNSESTIESLKLKISTIDKVYVDKKIQCNILPGETASFMEKVDLTELNKATEFKVEVYRDLDENVENNIKSFTLGYTDVNLDLDYYKVDNKIMGIAKLSNNTKIPADSSISIYEDSEDGILLDIRNVGFIDNGKDYIYTFEIDDDEIDFGEGDSKYYFVKVNTKNQDYNEENNKDVIIVYKDEEQEVSENPLEEVVINNVNGLSLNKDLVELGLKCTNHQSEKIEVIFDSNDVTYKDVTYKIEDERIATVDSNGLITAVDVGETKLIVTSVDGNYSAECIVKVYADHKPGKFEVVKEATITEEGLKERKCTICGEVVETEIIPKLIKEPENERNNSNNGSNKTENKKDEGKNKTVTTGDYNNVMVLALLLVMSSIVLIVVKEKKCKKNRLC